MLQLGRFLKRNYINEPTEIERLDRLSLKLGCNVYIKRDDLLPGACGGNKTRKLEFLVADALKKGCDTLVTVGAPQSNHCRLTAWAAAKEGLQCHLVIEERVPGTFDQNASGNNFLFKLFGVDTITVVPKGSNVNDELAKVCAELKELGKTPYPIPTGGSNEIGTLGYVSCAQEIINQLREKKLVIDHVVVPSGSAGTHAGLLVGFHASGCPIPVHGINVSQEKSAQEEIVARTASSVSTKLGFHENVVPSDYIVCYDDYFGIGYSLPTEAAVDALLQTARLEGILLDPVYSGKAMAGLIDLVKRGVFKATDNVLFIATGGVPSLFEYRQVFEETFVTKFVNNLQADCSTAL